MSAVVEIRPWPSRLARSIADWRGLRAGWEGGLKEKMPRNDSVPGQIGVKQGNGRLPHYRRQPTGAGVSDIGWSGVSLLTPPAGKGEQAQGQQREGARYRYLYILLLKALLESAYLHWVVECER